MKHSLFVFLFLLILVSCNSRTQKECSIPADTSGKYWMRSLEPLEDSTWYNLIADSWEKRDIGAFRPFFESWYQHTIKTDRTLDLPYRTDMDAIFKVIHDNGFSSYKGYREYAIFPSEIYYSVIDTAFRSYENERYYAMTSGNDTMYFRPNEKLLERKIIMWTDPYRRYIDAFLKWDHETRLERREKFDFIKYYIRGGFGTYFEEPIIHIIILNKDFDAAYVEYHDGESGMTAWLVKRDGEWIITKTDTRYIS
ncbi:MAG: hypothetical protein LBV72_04740 [Tannerella sp.]|nr:hypothetical protein [Tannerella sp.]